MIKDNLWLPNTKTTQELLDVLELDGERIAHASISRRPPQSKGQRITYIS